MSQHSAVNTVVERIRTDVIGGAADTAREVVDALAQLVKDSSAPDPVALSAELEAAVDDILVVLPSLAPPINAMHRLLKAVEDAQDRNGSLAEVKAALLDEAASFRERAACALQRIAQVGAELFADGTTIFTYSMSSTVWKALAAAKARGKRLHVIVTESRPANEGLWTVTEMDRYGIPVTVGIDAAVGVLVPGCSMAIVGADAITSHGHALCKVGTYPTALVAREHGVPFYILADTLKFDTSTLWGLPFRIDQVKREDVLPPGAPASALARSPHFDVTPPHLVTGIVTELGIINPTACFSVMSAMPLSRVLTQKIERWSRASVR